MSANPPDPKAPNDTRRELTGAIVRAVLAAALAVGLFAYSGRVDPEKKTFYLAAAAIGAIVVVVNGYSAWALYNKSKQPK
jgi:hypothetical protein